MNINKNDIIPIYFQLYNFYRIGIYVFERTANIFLMLQYFATKLSFTLVKLQFYIPTSVPIYSPHDTWVWIIMLPSIIVITHRHNHIIIVYNNIFSAETIRFLNRLVLYSKRHVVIDDCNKTFLLGGEGETFNFFLYTTYVYRFPTIKHVENNL